MPRRGWDPEPEEPAQSVAFALSSLADLEQWIQESALDDEAAAALRGESFPIQHAVVARGSVKECLNTSLAVLGRIRDCRWAAQQREQGAIQYNDLPDPNKPTPDGIPEQVQQALNAEMERQDRLADSRRQGTARNPWGIFMNMPLGNELEEFIKKENLDEKAAAHLRREPPHIQRSVLDRGSVRNCANPSSAVIVRIKDAKFEARRLMDDEDAPPTETAREVDAFITENRLDAGAARALRSEPEEIQNLVLQRGTLHHCSNPSSAVIGRIRESKQYKNNSKPVAQQRGSFGGRVAPY